MVGVGAAVDVANVARFNRQGRMDGFEEAMVKNQRNHSEELKEEVDKEKKISVDKGKKGEKYLDP